MEEYEHFFKNHATHLASIIGNICLVIFAVILFGTSILHPFFHSVEIEESYEKFVMSFKQIKHVQSSKLIAKKYTFGNFNRVGKHCDYFSAELRSTDKQENEIRAHYKNTKTWVVKESGWNKPSQFPVEILMISSDMKTEYLPTEYKVLNSWFSYSSLHDKTKNYYIIYVLDEGNDTYQDWRCS